MIVMTNNDGFLLFQKDLLDDGDSDTEDVIVHFDIHRDRYVELGRVPRMNDVTPPPASPGNDVTGASSSLCEEVALSEESGSDCDTSELTASSRTDSGTDTGAGAGTSTTSNRHKDAVKKSVRQVIRAIRRNLTYIKGTE